MKDLDNEKLKNYNDEVVDLFWTGGWDSTFRLLQLIFEEKKYVRPHYVMRPQECAGQEIDTLFNIRRIIERKFKESRKYILPIIFLDSTGIDNDGEINNEHEEIKSEQYISEQYQILARYCKQVHVKPIELCVMKTEIRDYFTAESSIFKYFSFPLAEMNKKDLYNYSQERGWMEIMNKTRFCRKSKNGKPCGLCAPCVDTTRAGMGWRLPLVSRVKCIIQLPLRNFWRENYLQNSERGLYKYIFENFKHRV